MFSYSSFFLFPRRGAATVSPRREFEIRVFFVLISLSHNVSVPVSNNMLTKNLRLSTRKDNCCGNVYVTSSLGHATRILSLLSASGRNDYGQCLFLHTKEQVSDYCAVISKLEYFNYWHGWYIFIFSTCFKNCCIYFHNHVIVYRMR